MSTLLFKTSVRIIAFCLFVLFHFLIFTGVQLLYNIVLVSTVQQSESAICIPISPLFWMHDSFFKSILSLLNNYFLKS